MPNKNMGNSLLLTGTRPKLPQVVKNCVSKNVTEAGPKRIYRMKNRNESGFSIIELLLVCVMIGVISALAVPALQKAIRAAENGTTFATMKTMAGAQAGLWRDNMKLKQSAQLFVQTAPDCASIYIFFFPRR